MVHAIRRKKATRNSSDKRMASSSERAKTYVKKPLQQKPLQKKKKKDIEFTNSYFLFSLFFFSILSLRIFFETLPKASSDVCDDISLLGIVQGVLPKMIGGKGDKMETVLNLWKCAVHYQQDYPTWTILCFMVVYIFFQTFAIPGPIILSILSGALYSSLGAQLLVAFCATSGACLCYFLSYTLGRHLVEKAFPDMLKQFREKIADNRNSVFYYMLFLRLTPLLPNWFVNVACPLVGVDFHIFALATFFGLLPGNFLHISTGATLHSAVSTSNNPLWNFALLFGLQFVALLPTLFKKRISAMEQQFTKKKEIKSSVKAKLGGKK